MEKTEEIKGEHSILKNAKIGKGSVIWNFCNLYDCEIGKNTLVGSYTEIQRGAKVGDNCRIQTGAFICEGTQIGDYVYIGPRVVFGNDKYPSARSSIDKTWKLKAVIVEDEATIGGNCTILPGVRIGKGAFIGAGSVVTKDVPANCLVYGNPAKLVERKMKPRVVFMGEKVIGKRCLEYLLALKCKVIGIATRKKTQDIWWEKQFVREIAEREGIPIIKRAEIRALKPDILLSVEYPFLIEEEIIKAAGSAYNMHSAPLPRYKGCNCSSHALMNGDEQFGVTLHELTPKVDEGRIVDKRYFPIEITDTAKSLFEKSRQVSYEVFVDNINNILSGEVKFTEFIDDGSKPYLKDSLQNKQIPTGSRKKAYDFVRALDFPPFEPAYFFNEENKKIHLKAEDFELNNFTLKDKEKEEQLKRYLGI